MKNIRTAAVVFGAVFFATIALAQFPNLAQVGSISRADFIPVDQAVSTSISANGRQSHQATVAVLAAAFNAAGADEIVPITGANTFASLQHLPVGPVEIWIDGKRETSLGSTPAYSISGQTIEWDHDNAGYSVASSDVAEAKYPY